jgi:poly-beta-1,6-N-acetyl-D-glucosamine synthase
MTIYFIAVFGIYFVLIVALLVGWFIAMQPVRKNPTGKRFISVIVPFRNEAEVIQELLTSLSQQTYPKVFFEVIFVNDHSTDHSPAMVQAFCQQQNNFKLIELATDKSGKKQAISSGILHSSGQLIATTDADCVVGPAWLEKINAGFLNQNQMLMGAVKIESDGSFFSKLQATEFASLMGSGFATAAFQNPMMANGANLAFRKLAFEKVNGYEGSFAIASGDDEHLMQKISKAFPNSIGVLAEQEAVVSTKSQPMWNDFIQQRIRWAGKWRFNKSLATKWMAVFVVLFQISWLMWILLFAFGKIDRQVGLIVMFIKTFLEFSFLYSVQLFLKIKWHWIPFFALQLLYPVYVVLVGLKSNFVKANWKGRAV